MPRTNPTNPNEVTLGTFAASPARAFPTFICHQMETLIINSHLTYPGWSDCKLNLTFLEIRFEKVAESRFLSAILNHPRKE